MQEEDGQNHAIRKERFLSYVS